MVFADRSFKAGTYEIKNTYAPFRVRLENGEILVKNLFDFSDFCDYTFEVEITDSGKQIAKSLHNISAEPGEEKTIKLPADIKKESRLGIFANVRMLDKSGFELGLQQLELPTKKIEASKAAALTLTETEFDIIAKGENFCYTLSKQSGNFISIIKNGEEQLAAPTKLSYYRAPTDNDRNVKIYWDRTNIWQGENYDCAFNKVYDCTVKDNKVTFNCSAAGVSRKPFFKYTLGFEFYADGKVDISLTGDIREGTYFLPRLGFEFTLKKENNRFSYFGNGPLESYCDMTHHGLIGYYTSDAAAEYVNYVRPQEHGNHTDCRELSIENSLKFCSSGMDISVLHHSIEALTAAQHTDELIESDATHIRVDYKVSGIGSNSCGPRLLEKYRLCEKHINFNLTLEV